MFKKILRKISKARADREFKKIPSDLSVIPMSLNVKYSPEIVEDIVNDLKKMRVGEKKVYQLGKNCVKVFHMIPIITFRVGEALTGNIDEEKGTLTISKF